MITIGHVGASPVNGRYLGVVVGVNGTTNGQTIEQYQQHTSVDGGTLAADCT